MKESLQERVPVSIVALARDVLQEAHLYTSSPGAFEQDIALLQQYVSGAGEPEKDEPEIKAAVHRVVRLVALPARLWFHESEEVDFQEPTVPYHQGDNIAYIFTLAAYPLPKNFHRTPLGKLLNAVLALMVPIDAIIHQSEVMKALNMSRQRVYDMTQAGMFTVIYSPSGRAVYFRQQIEAMKQAKKPREKKRTEPVIKRPKRPSSLQVHA